MGSRKPRSLNPKDQAEEVLKSAIFRRIRGAKTSCASGLGFRGFKLPNHPGRNHTSKALEYNCLWLSIRFRALIPVYVWMYMYVMYACLHALIDNSHAIPAPVLDASLPNRRHVYPNPVLGLHKNPHKL